MPCFCLPKNAERKTARVYARERQLWLVIKKGGSLGGLDFDQEGTASLPTPPILNPACAQQLTASSGCTTPSGLNEPQFPVFSRGRLENRRDRRSFREGAGLKTRIPRPKTDPHFASCPPFSEFSAYPPATYGSRASMQPSKGGAEADAGHVSGALAVTRNVRRCLLRRRRWANSQTISARTGVRPRSATTNIGASKLICIAPSLVCNQLTTAHANYRA
jgi:hypothetical protein